MRNSRRWEYLVPRPPDVETIVKMYGLTRRQAEVAILLYWRRTDKEIAASLEISTKTAAAHAAAVLSRLGVGSRRDMEQHLQLLNLEDDGLDPMR